MSFDPPLDNNSNFLIFFFLGQSNACGVGVGPLAGLAPTIAQLQLQQQPLHSVSFFEFSVLFCDKLDFFNKLSLATIWQETFTGFFQNYTETFVPDRNLKKKLENWLT